MGCRYSTYVQCSKGAETARRANRRRLRFSGNSVNGPKGQTNASARVDTRRHLRAHARAQAQAQKHARARTFASKALECVQAARSVASALSGSSSSCAVSNATGKTVIRAACAGPYSTAECEVRRCSRYSQISCAVAAVIRR